MTTFMPAAFRACGDSSSTRFRRAPREWQSAAISRPWGPWNTCFPITADDALRGVVFTDFGTVAPSVELKGSLFRAAPGFGVRITIPALGPAPIALDLAFPVAKADGDVTQVFSFFVGINR